MSEVKDISSVEGGAFPSLEVLQRYLRGEASADEKAQIEAMLEDDPMMADAIEGLEMIEDPAVLRRSIQKITQHSRQHLNRQINKREALIRRQSRIAPKNLLPYIGTAAAAIALLITTVFVIRQMDTSGNMEMAQDQVAKPTITEARPQADAALQTKPETDVEEEAMDFSANLEEEAISGAGSDFNQPIAQAAPAVKIRKNNNGFITAGPETTSPTEPQISSPAPIQTEGDDFELSAPQPSTPAAAIPQAPVTTGQAQQAIERDEVIALNDDAGEKSADSVEAEYFDEEELANIPVYENEERYGNTVPSSKEYSSKKKFNKQTSTAEPLFESAPRRSIEDIQQGQLERAAAITDMIAKAAKHLEAKEYDAAILQLDEVLLSEPQNLVAHHYRARAYIAKGNDEAAISSLETIVNIGTGENFESDQWALANAYLRLDKKLKARSLLKQIVKAGGTYAPQAEALLAE